MEGGMNFFFRKAPQSVRDVWKAHRHDAVLDGDTSLSAVVVELDDFPVEHPAEPVLDLFWGGFVLQRPYDERELDVFLHHDSVDHVTDETDCGLVEMGRNPPPKKIQAG